MSELHKVLRQLVSLLNDQEFIQEIRVYRCAYQRLKIRLRNNLFIAQLKHLTTLTRQLQVKYPITLLRTYGKNCAEFSGKKQRHAIFLLQKLISDFIQYLDKILDKMLHVYCLTQSNFKVGHLIHHLIVVRTSICRLSICFKALLVYASDLFMEISAKRLELAGENGDTGDITCERVRQILTKHSCKPRIERVSLDNEPMSSDNTPTIKIEEETIGPIIDRAKFRKKSEVIIVS